MSSQLLKSLAVRRSVYKLSKQDFPIPDSRVEDLVREVVDLTPSAFNAQTSRAVILFGKRHDWLWNEVLYNKLKAVLPEKEFAATGPKIQGFGAAYGTVLFYINQATVHKFENRFKLYAHHMRPWAEQSAGAAQINLWTALANEGAGANLQHYSALIDSEARQEFGVPEDWDLNGQLVFGTPLEASSPKPKLPSSETVKAVY